MPQALIDRRPQSVLARRTLLAGASAAATALALAACTEPTGIQAAEAGDLSASLTEYGRASRQVPVWQVTYDQDEDDDAPESYSAAAQSARHHALETKRTEQEWSASDPLVVLDPYGTTRTGLYVHFTDPAPGALEFTVTRELHIQPPGATVNYQTQLSVEARLDDDSLPEGQYYLEMYNNHWYMGTRDEEVWADVGPDSAFPGDLDGVSHILRYLIDENAGTFREDQRVDVAHSSAVSNVQRIGGDSLDSPMVANSGKTNVFTEHAADGELLATFRFDSSNMAYRVYKDPFEGFWFAGR